MTHFVQRRRGEPTTAVTFGRRIAGEMPEGLRHVAKHVFDRDSDESGHLHDAAHAVTRALAASPAGPVSVGLTAAEARFLPEALSYLGHEVFRDRWQDDAFHKAARQVSEAFPAAPVPGR